MKETDRSIIRPGVYSLSEIQTRSATTELDLGNPNLQPFHRTSFLGRLSGMLRRSLELSKAAEKRLEALRNDQSNEPLRPFLELLVNSLDYGTGDLRMYVGPAKNGGWTIAIGDMPLGEGMSAKTVLNRYLDPYASNSAENNRTATGGYKRGIMGVGAQQQFRLLRHKGDRSANFG